MSERDDRPRPERARPERAGGAPRRGGERSSTGRPSRDGSPRQARDARPPRRDADQPARPDWQTRVARPPREDAPRSPIIPDEITDQDIELGIRVQLKTLTEENAEKVARHLAMVNLLFEQDPALAHEHALAASRRAGRLAIVRETVGITAYQVEDWALALRELSTYRRLTGSNDHLPLMADCERGLGRPKKALELGRSVDRNTLPAGVRVNLAIVMSGARLDLGENELALAELEIPELNVSKVFEYSAQLFRAYSECLSILGRTTDAKKWSDLADRAEKHFSGSNKPEDEVFSVLEEIQIPEASDRNGVSNKTEHDDRSRAPRVPFRRDSGRDGERDAGRDRAPRTGGRDGAPRTGGRDGSRGGSRDGAPRTGGFRGRPAGGDSRREGGRDGGREGGFGRGDRGKPRGR